MGTLEEELTCPLCRDLYSCIYPLPCGHSFCRACVRDLWGPNRGEPKQHFVCPQCQEESGPVPCDCCPLEACAALKTCLRCEVSLCPRHLQPHLELPAYQTHQLVEPLARLALRRCPKHQELFRYYCSDDNTYICADCILEGLHSQHKVRALARVHEDFLVPFLFHFLVLVMFGILAGGHSPPSVLLSIHYLMLQGLLEKAGDKVRDVERILDGQQQSINNAFDTTAVDEFQAQRLSRGLQEQVERLVEALRESSREERQQALEQLQQNQERLRQELSQAENLQIYVDTLLRETDPFLLIWAVQCDGSQLLNDLNSSLFSPVSPNLNKKRILEKMEHKYSEFIEETHRYLNELKRELLSTPLTLDTSSAHPLLSISDDLRSAVRVRNRLPRSANPGRFDHWSQVMTAQFFSSGTHYWELEAEGFWDIAVTYPCIERKGKLGTAFGNNKVSWSLTQQHERKLAAWHNRRKTRLSTQMTGNRLAILLDYESGTITFSEVGTSCMLTHLYTFNTSFTQPVCLGFGLYKPDLCSRITIMRISHSTE
ncbi:nuclear factor 7, ovary [Denticeps clupeoides]|uniref:Uncharacterized protein n=1 Tax=Denticeps clupeoides TaxID=299321 RepID=A0AAY4ASS9_9TELE|nr:nuclear factor 7, ovary-like [Denticeps clupeoides]